MKEISIEEIEVTSTDYQDLLQFRNKLLREPLGLNLFDEDLSGDSNDIILIAKEAGKIIGCVMLQPADDTTVKLRQMAVDASLQGKGMGRILVENAEEAALQNGYKKIVLHARRTAEGFYEKLGYRAYGDIFTEVNIPHIAMKKDLD